ncbi:MAG TPA: alanine racemase [Anaerolineae bacterium]|nr:alanine racemase [Anaerolineae bacterium]HMR67413.1 alanine racemase [Anaerolineae bacterium]
MSTISGESDHPLTWAEVDLGAIRHNVQAIKAHLAPQTRLIAVVKANAYGHGAVPVARAALGAGAAWLAVNRVNEGVELREAGLEARILVLGYCSPEQAATIVRHRLTPALTTLETATALVHHLEAGQPPFPVHLKIDTGMGRLGLLPEEVADFARALHDHPRLTVEGIFSHLATADEADSAYSQRQFQIFQAAVQAVEASGYEVPMKHLANSAAGMRWPEWPLGWVRLGVSMYGLYPSTAVGWPVSLRPAMTLKTRVARLRLLPAGASLGYNRTVRLKVPTPIALAPVGYGDGYPRRCSNCGWMLVRGQRVPIVGTVAMDQTMLDVSGIEAVSQHDEVVVFGRQGEAEITAEEVGAWAGTINYEIVTRMAARVPRLYLNPGI